MVLSSVAFTLVNSGVKYLQHFPTFELVFFRAVGSAICCYYVILRLRISPLGKRRGLLLLRALIGLTAISLFFHAVHMMPLASAVALRYLAPLFATLFAALLLKERVKPIHWFFILTAFSGVILIKGFDPRISLGALGIILLSALFTGMVYVVIRKIGNSEHSIVIVNYFMTISALITGIISIFNWVSPVGWEWGIVASMGFFGFIAQYLMTRALQLAEASIATPFKYSEVLITILAGWLFFGEYITTPAFLGILVIIASLIGIVLVRRKPQKS